MAVIFLAHIHVADLGCDEELVATGRKMPSPSELRARIAIDFNGRSGGPNRYASWHRWKATNPRKRQEDDWQGSDTSQTRPDGGRRELAG